MLGAATPYVSKYDLTTCYANDPKFAPCMQTWFQMASDACAKKGTPTQDCVLPFVDNLTPVCLNASTVPACQALAPPPTTQDLVRAKLNTVPPWMWLAGGAAVLYLLTRSPAKRSN